MNNASLTIMNKYELKGRLEVLTGDLVPIQIKVLLEEEEPTEEEEERAGPCQKRSEAPAAHRIRSARRGDPGSHPLGALQAPRLVAAEAGDPRIRAHEICPRDGRPSDGLGLSLSWTLDISRRARVHWVGGYTQMQLFKSKTRRAAEKPPGNGKADAPSVEPDGKIYRPSEKEPFMDERQREYFRLKLLGWREDILKEAKETLQHLQDESQNHPDLADRASSETDRAIELRARDRQRKLIAKIDAALQRIEDGTYGYCEETGVRITLKRLEARPIATLSIEAQERHERRERVYRDD
jgi:DnaK suppressor protein